MPTLQLFEIIAPIRKSMNSYRALIDATIEQLSDEELRCRPTPESNSVAVLLRHLGGNLRSRWTDFLTTDGEKADRNRDDEFHDWNGDRASLMQYFDSGWKTFEAAVEGIDDASVHQSILIRGEPHTVLDAVTRSLTHVSYHVGQITLVARLVHSGEWRWLTIAPGQSRQHNEATWGTAASRSVLGENE